MADDGLGHFADGQSKVMWRLVTIDYPRPRPVDTRFPL
jgi:hypothetical protein